MNQPAIHLEEYYLEKVLIERREPEVLGDQIIVAFDFDYRVQRNANDPNLFLLTFIVRDDPKAKAPFPQIYKLDLRIQGIFRFNEGVEDADMQYLIRVNGGTILYGILRGMLTTIMGAFPEGRINLPTVMMEDVVRRIEERRAPKAPARKSTVSEKEKPSEKSPKKNPKKTSKTIEKPSGKTKPNKD